MDDSSSSKRGNTTDSGRPRSRQNLQERPRSREDIIDRPSSRQSDRPRSRQGYGQDPYYKDSRYRQGWLHFIVICLIIDIHLYSNHFFTY